MGWKIVIISVLLFLCAGYAQAEDKIGFVDVREIMLNSNEGKRASDEFRKVYEKNRLIIQGSEVELKQMKDELEKQRSILTEPALREKEAIYQQKFRDYQTLVKEANDDIQGKDQELSKKMIPEIQKIINSIGEKEKYSIIIDISSIPIPYYNKSADLTKRIMEEFNRSFKARKK